MDSVTIEIHVILDLYILNAFEKVCYWVVLIQIQN